MPPPHVLHTQTMAEPHASEYLRLVAQAVGAARLSKQFPDRRAYCATLAALSAQAHGGLYDSIYLDARSGLPNMASMTRVLADHSVAADALPRMKTQDTLDARRDEAQIYERLARKRPYYEMLARAPLAPVDAHRVLLRTHEPTRSCASFRVELTKLTADGCYVRVAIDLTQTATLWGAGLVELDEHGEVAHGTEALRGMVYRFAAFDAEALFVRLHELPGVTVERVARGVLGPLLFRLAHGQRVTQAPDNAVTQAFAQWEEACGSGQGSAILASFASDIAAVDVVHDHSNDPLSPLMAASLVASERARYRAARERFGFGVYKDRKFAASAQLTERVQAVCDAHGTANIVYCVP